MQPITYSLQSGDHAVFYEDLSRFTDSFLATIDAALEDELTCYRAFINDTQIETARSLHEYFIEFLAIGLFFSEYYPHARQSNSLVVKSLHYLFSLRKRVPRAKPSIDYVRGFLIAKLLREKTIAQVSYTITDFALLLNWLEAAGDFKEEVERLRNWQAYFVTRTDKDVTASLSMATTLAARFREDSLQALGKYTDAVKSFLQNDHPAYKNREDYIFCGRSEAEYHLNMVGAEILNRALRKGFEHTKEKAVLLPTCMCAPKDGICKAKHRGLEITCTSCTASCNANVIRGLLQQEGVATFLIPHSSSFSRFLEQWKEKKEIGLVGVACVLNLLTGGYEMMKLGIASQCVFLDYCGCRKHWHAEGIPTDLNAPQLLKIVSAKKTDLTEGRLG